MKFIRRDTIGGRTFDVVEVLPPGKRRPRVLVVLWDAADPTPFPIGTLTLDGPWVEMVEVPERHQRHGHGLALLQYASSVLKRPLAATLATAEGKRLLAKAQQSGIIAEPRPADEKFLDAD